MAFKLNEEQHPGICWDVAPRNQVGVSENAELSPKLGSLIGKITLTSINMIVESNFFAPPIIGAELEHIQLL